MPEMWAQVLVSPKRLEYKKVEIPSYGASEVLVRLKTAAICNGSDPRIFDGFEEAYSTPLVFGHEPFGEIVACGHEVKEFKPGDQVTWWFSLGAFAEYVAVNPSQVAMAKVPPAITPREAPILELVTASGRAVSAAGVQRGDRVLIIGLGPSGLIMTQQAKIRGAVVVVGWDLYTTRQEKGLSLGCDLACNPLDVDVVDRTRDCIEEGDIIIDAMGNDVSPDQSTLNKALRLLKKGGRVISYGHPEQGRKFDPFLFQSRSASLYSPENDMNVIRRILADGVKQVASGRLRLESLISEDISLPDVGRGLQMVREHPEKYLKVIVHIGK